MGEATQQGLSLGTCQACGAARADRDAHSCGSCGAEQGQSHAAPPGALGAGAASYQAPWRDSARPAAIRRPRRSVAWIYYAVLAAMSLIVAVSTGAPGTIVGTVLFGLYATYLYRGGSVVIWFW
jgi:hypothetical protein